MGIPNLPIANPSQQFIAPAHLQKTSWDGETIEEEFVGEYEWNNHGSNDNNAYDQFECGLQCDQGAIVGSPDLSVSPGFYEGSPNLDATPQNALVLGGLLLPVLL